MAQSFGAPLRPCSQPQLLPTVICLLRKQADDVYGTHSPGQFCPQRRGLAAGLPNPFCKEHRGFAAEMSSLYDC